MAMKNLILKFQPTSPVRETTLTNLLMALWQNGFQPTSPVRETTKYEHRNDGCNFISTHVPRAGDDVDVLIIHNFAFKFQPTSPVRETTCPFPVGVLTTQDFNPRPPCGRRPAKSCRPSAKG